MAFGKRPVLYIFFPIGQMILWCLDCSQQCAATSLLALAHLQRCSGSHLEHFPHAVLGLGRALQVPESTDPVGHVSAFFRLHGFLRRNDST